MLVKAKRPLVIAGSGIVWSKAWQELQTLIETLKAPLVLTQMARGAVPEDHPLCFGPTRGGAKQADVVLLIGTRLNFSLNFGRPPLFGVEGKSIHRYRARLHQRLLRQYHPRVPPASHQSRLTPAWTKLAPG